MPLLWYRDEDGTLKPYTVPGDALSFTEAVYAPTIPLAQLFQRIGTPSAPVGDHPAAFTSGYWTCPIAGAWMLVLDARVVDRAISVQIQGPDPANQTVISGVATKPTVAGGSAGAQVVWASEMEVGDQFGLYARVETGANVVISARVTAIKLRRFNTATGGGGGGGDEYLLKGGDTMLGPLILDSDPTLALAAATKQYTDYKVVNSYGQASTTRAPSQAAVEGAVNAANAHTIGAGGGLTGGGALSANPTLAVGAGTGITVTADTVAVNTATIATVATVNNLLGAAGRIVRYGTIALGSIAAGASAGPFTDAHGMGKSPGAVTATAYADTGVQSIVISIVNWDATNITFLARNVGGGAETANCCWIAIG